MRTATLANDPKLTRIASALREEFGVRLTSALLFGSRARGDHRPDSDYDVAVFLNDFDREKDKEAIGKLREQLGEEVWTLQFWPLPLDGLAQRTTLMFNIRNEAVPLPGFDWPSVVAPPIAPDEGGMKPESKVLLEGADASLATAQALVKAGFAKPAAREAHQAVLRATRALIFEERNTAPKTHNGAVTLLSDLAIKTGRLEERIGNVLSRGLDMRTDVDYEPVPKTTDQQAIDYVHRAAEFVIALKRLIEQRP